MDCQVIIKQYFNGIEEGNGKPLYQQLQKCIKTLIGELSDNSLFPSERELAESLKVNRRTLRKAMEPFIATGQLRRSRRGTVVRHLPVLQDSHDDKFNPFVQDITVPAFCSKQQLKIMLYEPYPFQKQFWAEVIAIFNQENPGLDLKCVYSESNSAAYWREFDKAEFDLVHLPVSYNWKPAVTSILAEIPESLRQYQSEPEFASEMFGQTAPELLQYSIPYAFTPRVYCWNRRYVEHLKLDVRHQSIEEILEKATALPDDIATVSTFYDLCLDLAVPEHFTMAEISSQTRILLKRLRLARKRSKFYLSTELFKTNNENLLLCNTFTSSLKGGHGNLLHYLFSPVKIRKGGLLWGGNSTLGINRYSRCIYDARLFIKFMLSEKIQHKIAGELLMAPVRRSEWRTIAHALDVDAADLEKSLERCRENPRAYPPPVGLVMSRFQEIMTGKVSDAKAMELIVQYYWNILDEKEL